MRTTNLDKSYSAIFTKGPSVLLQKIRKSNGGNQTITIFGFEFEPIQFWLLSGLLLLFIFSFVGTILMFCTNTFDNLVFSKLAIVENSESYSMWQKPTPRPLVKIHIFNYTNVEEFENGDAEKLNVKDIGPYVYEMSLERNNVHFNSTRVTYQEQRTYKFLPHLSHPRKQNDQLTAPNIPMLTAASISSHQNYFARLATSTLFDSLSAAPFLRHLAAHRFITGYEDALYRLSKSILKLQNQKPYETFGLLSSTIGLTDDTFTVDTGVGNIDHVTNIHQFNNAPSLTYWSTAECNSLAESTDGAMFSPKKVRNRRNLKVYVKEMCRSIPLTYDSEVRILSGRIPAYRYVFPETIYDSPDRTPSQQCYCNLDSGLCPPQGVFNVTPCAFGAPAFLSFPHFHNGDRRLLEGVTGLQPDKVPHRTYVDVHPTLGFVMAGKNRFQLNIQVVKSFGMSQLKRYEDGLMLPVAWFEIALEDKTLPDDIVGIIFQTTFTLKSVEMGLRLGCVLGMIVAGLGVGVVIRRRWGVRGRTSSVRPLRPDII